jgi:hypothetical protein
MPYMPQKFSEKVAAKYSRQDVKGMSHQNLQYDFTTSHEFDKLKFVFVGESPEEVEMIHEGRKFLLSLMYPSAGASSVRDGAPTRVLFIWPRVVTMTCVFEEIEIEHVKFNRQGRTTSFNVTLKPTEIRDVRITAEEIRQNGTRRSSAAPSDLRDLPTVLDNNLELRDLPPELEG